MAKRQLRRSYDDRGFKGRKIYGDRKRKRLEEVVDMIELKKDLATLRLVGPLVPYAQWWIDITTKDGKKVSIPKVPQAALDPKTGELDSSTDDPYSEVPGARLQVFYLINAIDRDAQENEPRRKSSPTQKEDKTGFKEKDSSTWTPVGVVRIPPMVAQNLQALETKNRYKIKSKDGRSRVKTFDLMHPKYGRDVYISKDKDATSPSTMYKSSLADKSPLTDDEMDYLIWDLDGLAQEGGPFEPESAEEARREADALMGKGDGLPSREDGDEDNLEEDFLEEDGDGEDMEDLDELPWDDPDEDEKPKKKPRKRKSKEGGNAKEGSRKRKRRKDSDSGAEDRKSRLKSRKRKLQKRRKLRSE